ncbi:MAG: ubiquinone/menaquinone biosynthesis methyltransferase [Actinobacteria bacterium]|nr:ubiquinone/menaquinone biosynthesis methyltransferase [Actinomycetota bacterium]
MPDPRPGPDKDARLVRRMFDRVAPRYDLANTVFSLGRDRHWRRAAARVAGAAPGRTVVDVAAGTGALSGELAEAGATVVAVDFSWRMLRVGAGRRSGVGRPGRVDWCAADALRLPLPDAAADAATIAFGLRNLPDAAAGLTEMARVVRPGGRLVVLEFSRPEAAVPRVLFDRVVLSAVPLAARLVTSDPAAYGYLADSIRRWPDPAALAALAAATGWRAVRWRGLTGGVVALHWAERAG